MRSAAGPEQYASIWPPGARSDARLAVDDDHRVAELRPPLVELPVDYDAAADAGAEGQHHDVRGTATGAEPQLGQRRSAAVVDGADRQTQP
jgi:hypothetical protein